VFDPQVIFKKFRISYDEIINDLCPVRYHTISRALTHPETKEAEKWVAWILPKVCIVFMQVLSVEQVYKICTQYWDDKYNTESVSEEVNIKVMDHGSCKPMTLNGPTYYVGAAY
jgi:myosin V